MSGFGLFGLTFVVAQSLSLAASSPADPTSVALTVRHELVRVDVCDAAALGQLERWVEAHPGCEIWTEVPAPGPVEVRVAIGLRGELARMGMNPEVVIADLEAHFDRLFALPAGASGDFFDAYRTYDEFVAYLHELADAHPDLASLVVLGQSVEGRDLLAIRITGVGNGDDKPSLIYHGGQHGNEIHCPPVIAYTARHLLENYGVNDTVTRLVDTIDWYLLPLMNPDGYERRTRYNARGVDLNRNWGGPDTDERAWSEPETAAMRDFFMAHRDTRVHVDLHSSGQLVLFPWGHTSYTPEDWTFRWMAAEMVALIHEHRGSTYEYGTILEMLYRVIGGSIDYSYSKWGTWALAYELGTRQAPPASEIRPTCEEILPSLLYIASTAVDCDENGVWDDVDIREGISEDRNGNRMPDSCERRGDGNLDGVIDLVDLFWFPWPHGLYYCMRSGGGPDGGFPRGCCNGYWCAAFDFDFDLDVDLADVAAFQVVFEGQ
jgi:hypothetical protein